MEINIFVLKYIIYSINNSCDETYSAYLYCDNLLLEVNLGGLLVNIEIKLW